MKELDNNSDQINEKINRLKRRMKKRYLLTSIPIVVISISFGIFRLKQDSIDSDLIFLVAIALGILGGFMIVNYFYHRRSLHHLRKRKKKW